jgi:hypothetical protein
VFAVKQSLVEEFEEVDDAAQAQHYGVTAPFRRARFDIVLAPAGSASPRCSAGRPRGGSRWWHRTC